MPLIKSSFALVPCAQAQHSTATAQYKIKYNYYFCRPIVCHSVQMDDINIVSSTTTMVNKDILKQGGMRRE